MLNLLYGRFSLTHELDAVDNLTDEELIFTRLGGLHRLTDCSSNLLAIEASDTAISL
jgi:hypothetical protein